MSTICDVNVNVINAEPVELTPLAMIPNLTGANPSDGSGVSILAAVTHPPVTAPQPPSVYLTAGLPGDNIEYVRPAPTTSTPPPEVSPRQNYAASTSRPGLPVEFTELVTDTALNGKAGVLLVYLQDSDRWLVRLSSASLVCARCTNLVLRGETPVRVDDADTKALIQSVLRDLPPPRSMLDDFDPLPTSRADTGMAASSPNVFGINEILDNERSALGIGLSSSATSEAQDEVETFDDAQRRFVDWTSLYWKTAESTVCGLADTTNVWNRPRILKLLEDVGLIDPGANICMTHALALLHNVRRLRTPLAVGVALDNDSTPRQSVCTHVGELPLRLSDGNTHFQLCYYNPQATETFISPQAIVESSDVLAHWSMQGSSLPNQGGSLRFESEDGHSTFEINLTRRNGLYYCSGDTFSPAPTPLGEVNSLRAHLHDLADLQPIVDNIAKATPRTPRPPTTKEQHLEHLLWSSRLAFPSDAQMDVITDHAEGLPSKFAPHPFAAIDVKLQATVSKQPAGKKPSRVSEAGQRFYMDFAFMRASADDYGRRSKEKDRVIRSFDGYTSHLVIVDEVSRYVWVFLTKSKEPPVDLIRAFLKIHGRDDGGLIRTDQGGELANSAAFRKAMFERKYPVDRVDWNGDDGPTLRDDNDVVKPYILEATGADSPSQNGAVERWNQTLGNTVRVLLYGAGLPAQYWSAALLHAVYIHNRRVHSATRRTPFESWFGRKPDLRNLRLFGSRVCVKMTGTRGAKLDRHDFKGIFLGYSATDTNIRYMDLETGVLKRSPHAVFDEAWYTFDKRPPAAQYLYNLGLENEQYMTDVYATMQGRARDADPTPDQLPCTVSVSSSDAAALDSRVNATFTLPHSILEEYGINTGDMAMAYFSSDPYDVEFVETLDIRRLDVDRTPTAGLMFTPQDNRLILNGMTTRSPGAKHPRWKSRLKGAHLVSVAGTPVSTRAEVVKVFAHLQSTKVKECKLTFSHPEEVFRRVVDDGVPLITMDQLNHRYLLGPTVAAITGDAESVLPVDPSLVPQLSDVSKRFVRIDYDEDDPDDVLNLTTRVHKLTRRKLHGTEEWPEWQQAEWLQLDQYATQGMFGEPVRNPGNDKCFNMVWTYAEKVLDKRKKARCTLDGSARGGNVRVLDHTYANCVEQTGQRLFYGVAAVENLVIFGADASNAFGEAPGPKQGTYIRPDAAFRDWWFARHKSHIPDGYVIPVLRAMQGHPESPRLWEKHIDRILREELGFSPTVHEPCLYCGEVEGKRVLFLRQVDDFACAAPTQRICDIVFDMIDDHLQLTLKRLGQVTLFNGIDVLQTEQFVKISVETFIENACTKYQGTWLKEDKQVPHYKRTPLPRDDKINTAVGDPDEKAQRALEKEMGLSYRSIVGELTYAMITCRPDIAHAVVKLAQANACPSREHYIAAKHCMTYLHETRSDGIYFWRTTPRSDLDSVSVPARKSAPQSRLDAGRAEHSGTDLHCFVDSDWATDPLTRRSFTGICMRFAGGTIGYKTRLQPTVALSSTEAEFMAACDAGKMLLYVRSILYDLGIPQEAASVIYEDNDGATAMANAKKPTTRTRHMDIRYFALCDWVERDLVVLERVDTAQNLADHFTKRLDYVKFACHTDYVMGRVIPPHSPVYRASCVSDVDARVTACIAGNSRSDPYAYFVAAGTQW